MKYLSVCSGIEAASVAWHPLGWKPLAFSEIEPFPRAVLAHHYPDVPCYGDFTQLRDHLWIDNADVLVGGTPCQAFSVAGLRKSLADDRGNLSLEYVRLADAIDDLRRAAGRPQCIVVWENVPGVLSVKDNAFGCFLAALAGDVAPYSPPRGKWTNAGVVDGPARTVAWRILDAQYFGLAQRRRRVFVVASARDGFDPAAVLLEFKGVRRDIAPRREAGQGVAAGAGRGATERSSHWDGVEHPHPTLNQSHNTGGVGQSNQELFSQRGAYLVEGRRWPADIAPTLNAHFGEKQGLEDQHALGGAGLFVPGVTHALRGEGFDASEDGTGRGTPLVPVAFSYKDSGNDATVECSPTLRSLGAYDANGGGQMAVTYPINTQIALRHQALGERTGMGIGSETDPGFTLQAGHSHAVAHGFYANEGTHGSGLNVNLSPTLKAHPKTSNLAAVATSMAVRRLTPVECERLQGFPDGYTMIPWKKKPATDCPDGPRYKALGNSMAVPVMRWIGARIAKHLRGEL